MDTGTELPLDPASLEALSARLRAALGNRSITWLQEQLQVAGVEGSRYSNVQRYVAGNGKSPPSPTWLRAAANVLGVRPAWLAFEDGHKFERVEQLRAGAVAKGEAFGREILAALRKGLERDLPLDSLDPAWRFMGDYVTKVDRAARIGPNVAQEVGEAIVSPIKTLGFGPADFGQESYGHYVAAVAESLRFLIAGMGDPEGEED